MKIVPENLEFILCLFQATHPAVKGADKGDQKELEEVQHQVQPEGRPKVQQGFCRVGSKKAEADELLLGVEGAEGGGIRHGQVCFEEIN